MKRKKIIVVEDDYVIQLFIGNVLHDLGFEIVEQVHSYPEAIRVLEVLQPDLILMDVGLHNNVKDDDFHDISALYKHIPVIYITGNAKPMTHPKAERKNRITFLFKPFNEDDLKGKVLDCLSA
jgi:CheY-like chemotaxis protein